MSGKNALIVLCHPEVTSFSHAMADTAKSNLEKQGYIVQISDLYTMGFDPVNDRRNFTGVKNPDRFNQQAEEANAVATDGFNESIKAEMDKVAWCDLLIFQCPINWFALPAMLKGWVDKVFASGFAYGGGKWYDVGIFKGKKALLSITTGAPGFMFLSDGIQGDIDQILFPITHGIFFFCGFTPLKPYVVYSPSHVDEATRTNFLAAYGEFITNIDTAPVLKYRGVKDAVMTPGPRPLFPDKATKMITAANSMMQSWVENNKAAYKALVLSDVKMTIPAYGVDVVGVDAIWSIRDSMGAAKLNPHTCDSHTFPDQHTVKLFAHVLDPKTGKRVQLSECTFKFEEGNDLVAHYHQENIFMAQA